MTLIQGYNRLTAWVYHLTHGISERPASGFGPDHLKECAHCRKKFEQWRAKEKETAKCTTK